MSGKAYINYRKDLVESQIKAQAYDRKFRDHLRELLTKWFDLHDGIFARKERKNTDVAAVRFFPVVSQLFLRRQFRLHSRHRTVTALNFLSDYFLS